MDTPLHDTYGNRTNNKTCHCRCPAGMKWEDCSNFHGPGSVCQDESNSTNLKQCDCLPCFQDENPPKDEFGNVEPFGKVAGGCGYPSTGWSQAYQQFMDAGKKAEGTHPCTGMVDVFFLPDDPNSAATLNAICNTGVFPPSSGGNTGMTMGGRDGGDGNKNTPISGGGGNTEIPGEINPGRGPLGSLNDSCNYNSDCGYFEGSRLECGGQRNMHNKLSRRRKSWNVRR